MEKESCHVGLRGIFFLFLRKNYTIFTLAYASRPLPISHSINFMYSV